MIMVCPSQYIQILIKNVAKCWYCETGGIMSQYKFCLDKQQYYNPKPFPVYIVATEVIENHYEYSNMVHEQITYCVMCYIRVYYSFALFTKIQVCI